MANLKDRKNPETAVIPNIQLQFDLMLKCVNINLKQWANSIRRETAGFCLKVWWVNINIIKNTLLNYSDLEKLLRINLTGLYHWDHASISNKNKKDRKLIKMLG